jgi:antitoxin CptB
MTKELLLKRLAYRSSHRGCKETDLIFGKFSENKLNGLDPVLLAAYEKLLDEDDADIWNWLVGKEALKTDEYSVLIGMLREYGNL